MNAPRFVSLLGLALAASCASAHPPTTSIDAQSGARLRAWALDAGDGARRFDGWHDLALDVDCTFIPTTEGPWRCRDVAFAEIVYRDAACTDPIVVWGRTPRITSARYVYTYDTTPSTCAVGGLGSLGSLGTLAPIVDAHRIGDPLDAPARVFRGSEGACSSYVPSPLLGTPTYAELGEAVPLDHFVGATERSVAHGALDVIELVAEDGATQLLEVRAPLDAPCRAARFEDGWRCAPREQAQLGSEFADPTCSVRSAFVASGPECTPAHALLVAPSCGGPATLHPLERVTGPLYSSASGTCMPTSPPSEPNWAAVGEALAGEALEAAAPSLALHPVGGALALQRFDASDGSLVAFGEWLDVEGASCRLYETEGGSVCLRALFTGGYFSDPSCSMPLATPLTDCAEDPPNAVLTRAGLFAPGPAYTGETYALGASGCALSPATVPLFALGPPLDVSALPRVVRTLD